MKQDNKSKAPKKKEKRQNDVREGQGNSSVWSDKQPPDKHAYPRQGERDEQFDNQPEFIDRDSNRKSK